MPKFENDVANIVVLSCHDEFYRAWKQGNDEQER